MLQSGISSEVPDATNILSSLFSLIVLAARIDELAPAELSLIESGNESLCSSDIGSKRYVVNIAKAKQTFLCLRDLFCRVGASEIEDQIYLVKGNSGRYLFGSARATRKEGFYLKSGSVRNILTGSVCCKKVMTT